MKPRLGPPGLRLGLWGFRIEGSEARIGVYVYIGEIVSLFVVIIEASGIKIGASGATILRL